jgi:multidrug efflux system membrane fusion protein
MKSYESNPGFAAAAALVMFASALAAATLAGCSSKGSEVATASTRAVQVAPVKMAMLDNTLRAVGLLSPKDEARLSFKVGGVIESIKVEEGQMVKAGQVLAALKQTEIGASVEQARQATTKAHRDLERAKALLADGVTTEEGVQDLTTAYDVAVAAQSGTEFNAAHTRIIASADGMVLRKLAQTDEVVQAGQTVMILSGARRGWVVRIGMADRDVVRTHLGDAARIEFDAWPGQPFAGHVTNIASSADSGTGTFTVELQVDPGSARFAQGLVAKVALTPQGSEAVKVIPVQALIEANDKEAGVFVLDPDHHVVHRVSIQIGRMNGGQIEVLEGLNADAQVVTDGAAFLENGEVVRVAAR